jgi:hypothetical protein
LPKKAEPVGGVMNFEGVLKEVVCGLVTEGGISYRRIKLSFGLDDWTNSAASY